ncbi:hypothetical protein QMZ62_24100 [Serratia sp. PF2-63]|uniref:hypothetical protein n=1 Tax=unclassified Serratia (in: enterobacteria) TaxID=2647522 RepID=UPI0024B5E9A4|nr:MULTISPECIES: hypothetical protein [unclassified Serratia (in: enterobacteria)]MDI9266032.1 hypothetical protein [Serratia sp. PF2-63]MDI9266441.1 hypothetical protein [Serratia sp. PF-27]
MKQSEVREEVEMIVKAMKNSDEKVPTFSQALMPSLKYSGFCIALAVIGVVPRFLLGLRVDEGLLLFAISASVVANLFMGAFIYAYHVQYLSIPEVVRNNSKILLMMKEKVVRYACFHCGILLVFSAVFLPNGTSAFIVLIQFPLFIFTGIALSMDLSRYNIPSIAGLVNAAKDEFKNNELQEFINGVNKEKK